MKNTIHTLLHPFTHLFSISRLLDEGKTDILIDLIIQQDYVQVLQLVNEWIDDIRNFRKKDERSLLLLLELSQFHTSIQSLYSYVEDLEYHKQSTNALDLINIVNVVLKKYNIKNHQEIGKEIFFNIMQASKSVPLNLNKTNSEVDVRATAFARTSKAILKK
ncbi:hypothetical protein ACR79K_26650 [Sphingobacterium siyangense]|uniref:hypothetical protein n=1 Tax=Sphingobacterium siyangense TaxID=459529 RepID=UPI003DA290E7